MIVAITMLNTPVMSVACSFWTRGEHGGDLVVTPSPRYFPGVRSVISIPALVGCVVSIPRYRQARTQTVINASHSMRTRPPIAYIPTPYPRLPSQPDQSPPQSYQLQHHPADSNFLVPPAQIIRYGSRDFAQPRPRSRPATIPELAEKAFEDLWDPDKSFKHWLRTAQFAREAGEQFKKNGDYDRSFIQLARAATLILEKIPTHMDYHTLLSANQRKNLILVSLPLPSRSFSRSFLGSSLLPFPAISLSTAIVLLGFDVESLALVPSLTLVLPIQNGEAILDNLSGLKPGFVDRYQEWAAKYPEYLDDPSLTPLVLLESAALVPSSPNSPTNPTPIPRPNSRESRRDRDRELGGDRERDGERERERDKSLEPPRDYSSQPGHDPSTRRNEEARRAAEEAIRRRIKGIRNENPRRAAEEAIRRRTEGIRNVGSGRVHLSLKDSVKDAGIAQRRQEPEIATQDFGTSILGGFPQKPLPDLPVLVDLGVPACRRLISHPSSPREVISLIEAVFTSEEEIKIVRDFRGDDAQSFIDVVHEVRFHLPSYLGHNLITFVSFRPSLSNSHLPLIRL